MQLGRVTGTVVASVKVPGLTGIKLLLVQPLDRELRPVGSQVVAADAVHMAGPGELVYIVAAREAAQAMPDPFVPVDHAIVGIVDAVRSLTGDGSAPPAPRARPAQAAGSSPAIPAPKRTRRPKR
jgi:ethanolamine utilization protein EutN